MFSATVSSGTSVVSWVTVAIPAAIASPGDPKLTCSPPIATCPESGASWPETIPSKVDLPDPFCPTRPWISLGRPSKDAPRRACTPP